MSTEVYTSFTHDWYSSVAVNTDNIVLQSQGTLVDTVMTGPRT
eukprot:CAMPEP_0185001538 /NCGR_PEP_ID=MMETSP1098-20130426/71350_1 /TAXON_ID=89044 /ORGANISM="Spumella elongata, Strain CCAP 955/1" /LENGTH=42 /DNA_ID= /DNA_START= /DNA_END= /DNA_ORIENTATION=